MLTNEVKANRLRILEETRELYYGPNWEPLETRAIGEEHLCMYRTGDGRMCAAGRLAPDAEWAEGNSIWSGGNNSTALATCIKHGLFCGDEAETLQWLRQLQWLHDGCALAEGTYFCMKAALQ